MFLRISTTGKKKDTITFDNIDKNMAKSILDILYDEKLVKNIMADNIIAIKKQEISDTPENIIDIVKQILNQNKHRNMFHLNFYTTRVKLIIESLKKIVDSKEDQISFSKTQKGYGLFGFKKQSYEIKIENKPKEDLGKIKNFFENNAVKYQYLENNTFNRSIAPLAAQGDACSMILFENRISSMGKEKCIPIIASQINEVIRNLLNCKNIDLNKNGMDFYRLFNVLNNLKLNLTKIDHLNLGSTSENLSIEEKEIIEKNKNILSKIKNKLEISRLIALSGQNYYNTLSEDNKTNKEIFALTVQQN